MVNRLVINNARGVSLFQLARVGGYAEEIIKELVSSVWKARSKKLDAGSIPELIFYIPNLDNNCA